MGQLPWQPFEMKQKPFLYIYRMFSCFNLDMRSVPIGGIFKKKKKKTDRVANHKEIFMTENKLGVLSWFHPLRRIG